MYSPNSYRKKCPLHGEDRAHACKYCEEIDRDAPQYHIWSNEHRGWWAPNRCGYVIYRDMAGVYSEKEALSILQNANYWYIRNGDVPNEIAVRVDSIGLGVERGKIWPQSETEDHAEL